MVFNLPTQTFGLGFALPEEDWSGSLSGFYLLYALACSMCSLQLGTVEAHHRKTTLRQPGCPLAARHAFVMAAACELIPAKKAQEAITDRVRGLLT
jgi:hypothetical protein